MSTHADSFSYRFLVLRKPVLLGITYYDHLKISTAMWGAPIVEVLPHFALGRIDLTIGRIINETAIVLQ